MSSQNITIADVTKAAELAARGLKLTWCIVRARQSLECPTNVDPKFTPNVLAQAVKDAGDELDHLLAEACGHLRYVWPKFRDAHQELEPGRSVRYGELVGESVFDVVVGLFPMGLTCAALHTGGVLSPQVAVPGWPDTWALLKTAIDSVGDYEELRRRLALELDEVIRHLTADQKYAPREAGQPIARDPELEARDKWLYQQCCRLVRYQSIIRNLAKRHAKWPSLGSVNGVKDAANAYAKRHNLPPIPKRSRGRPSRP